MFIVALSLYRVTPSRPDHKRPNDVKSRNVVTSQETESAVSVSCDVTTFLDFTSFRLLYCFLFRYCMKTPKDRMGWGLGSKILPPPLGVVDSTRLNDETHAAIKTTVGLL